MIDACTTSAHASPRSAWLTCGLSAQSCAFGAACSSSIRSANLSKPVIPAAGSAWPTFALIPPMANGLPLREVSRAVASEPASIGSPSAVPVPCASLSMATLAVVAASASAASSRPCCACPFGAVKLADRPS
eukprot:6636209-Prymnesium_polylepis.4